MRYAVICMLLLAASGCTAARQAPSPEPGLVPPPVVTTPEEKAENPGSLFSDENADLLYADYRARRVGGHCPYKYSGKFQGREQGIHLHQ